ncbi:TonB-dependent receptor plug domain-containing protein [Thermaurantiacus sp.]
MTHLSRAALRGGAASLALSIGFLAAPAFAQSTAATADAPDTIIVTGTRIARPNIEQSSPVSVIDETEISFRQPLAAEEFLRELPGVAPNIGPGVNNGTNGSAQIDLRGLGSNRNLVLLDGRRVVPATTAGVVDLNNIPVALLERVDVLTGGASTQYGADAIAGVVNFVTRRNFTGVDSSTNVGLAEEGDGRIFRTDLTVGASFDDGRGNAVLSIGYSDSNPVLQGDRPWGAVSLSSTTGLPQGSATATPATILFPFTAAVNPEEGRLDRGRTVNYNFNPLNVYQTPLERYSIFAKASYEVSDQVEVYGQAQYVKSVVDQQIAPSGTFFSTVNLPISNPFLTPTMREQLCAGYGISPEACATAATVTNPNAPGYIERPIQIGRRFTEAGPRRTNFATDMFQVTAGARGPLTDSIDWDIYFSYGESERTNTSTGQGLRSRLQQALRATSRTTCVDPSNGCVPINLFGADGTITPAMFDFLNVATFSFNKQQFTTIQGTLSGDFGYTSPLAENPVAFAFGGEYRKYKGATGGDGLSRQSGEVLGAGAPALPIVGEYDTREFFGELNAPLISGRPLFQELTIEGGVRYADYSTSGGNLTYNAGGGWAPFEGVRFRGNYARAVRAPNLGELFQPQVTFLTNRTVDPCQLALPLANPTVRAICEEQLRLVGAPLSLIGSIPAPIAGQINATSGGNPDLDPEKGTTWSAGVVVSPRFLPNFTATVDYYNIRVADAISSPSQADIIDGCFGQTDPRDPRCLSIRRNPLTGGLSGPNDTTFGPFLGSSNLGKIATDGIDWSLSWRTELGPTTFGISMIGNYTFSNKFQATPTSPNRECAGYYSISCGPILPTLSFQLRPTLSLKTGTDISLRWRYIDGVELEPLVNKATIFDAYESIDAYNYFDLAIAQQIGENVRITFSVENLADKDPPVVGNTVGTTAFNSGNTYPTTYDAIGRKYRLGVNLRF